jgi:hypothetical protein
VRAIIFLLVISTALYSQNIPGNMVGFHYCYSPTGKSVVKIINGNKVSSSQKTAIGNVNKKPKNINYSVQDSSTSHIRYVVRKRYSIGEKCGLTGDGSHAIISWELNESRFSLYSFSSPTPVWEFLLPNHSDFNFVSISKNGNLVLSSYEKQIKLFNGNNGTGIWVYDMSQVLDTLHSAGNSAITKKGDFIIGSANRRSMVADTSFLLGFNISSSIPVWKINLPVETIDDSYIIGIKISGNDSLTIVNSYTKFFIIKTYTGEIIYTGEIDPYNYEYSGSGANQGISGDGSVIAVINNYGYVWVYKWDGKKYNLLWEDWEQPDAYYNWMTCVDISYDGTTIAAGTLNKYNPSIMQFEDGKVKLYKTYNGNIPVWEYCGDSGGVNCVALSNNGKILSAVSSGALYTQSTNNLVVFNTSKDTNILIFALNDIGSFNCTSISDDGTTVIASGKAVPNSQMGYGGIYYNIFVDTSANPFIPKPNNNEIPKVYKLYQNYPNPFNPSTKIKFDLPKQSVAKIVIYDVTGREVAASENENLNAGIYEVEWNADGFASGVYLYSLKTNEFFQTKKMVLVK